MTDTSEANLIEGLCRFQEDLKIDFSLNDVLKSLMSSLTKDEFKKLKEIRKNDLLVDRLLFYYIYIQKNVRPLILSLRESYEWIHHKIYYATPNDKWISDYRVAIRDIPNNKDSNVHRTDYLWTIQQDLKTLKRGQYLVLFGKLGFGKKWLASDACRDYGVVSKMDFKIYWLNVSKCSSYESILDKLHRLKVLLQAEDYDIKYNAYNGNAKNEIVHVKSHLRKVLERPEFKNCLIVLTDIQDENVIRSFDLNCKMLLTTRHREKVENSIPTENRKIIEINKGLTQSESSELFSKAFQHRNELPSIMKSFIDDVHKICDGHPFILSLVAKTFQNMENDVKKISRCCDDWRRKLSKHNVNDEYFQIKMPIDESLKNLTEFQLKCYHKMVIFSDNINVPIEVLSKLWDMEHLDTKNLIEKFYKYSLVEKQMNNEACSLHYIHYKYLKDEVNELDRESYHRELIENYNVELYFLNRTDLELKFPDDGYFHFFIGYHIFGANYHDLFDLYLDFGFLEEKIRIAKLPNTLGDLKKFEKQIIKNDKKRGKFFKELLEFLPTVEQLIFTSEDMTLLQCALNYEGLIKEEAEEQIKNFKDRVWMDDINHVENNNQMFEIQADSHPQIVRFAKFDHSQDVLCLISLKDNNILLHDVATNYSEGPVLYKNSIPHSDVIDMQIFRNQAFLVLNDQGKLSVYNLKTNTARRASIPSRLSIIEPMHERPPFIIDSPNDKFTCFNIIEQNKDDYLFVGTKNGVIKIYRWMSKSNKFEDQKRFINTKFENLYRMAFIDNYIMVLNTSGNVKFFDSIGSGELECNVKWPNLESPVNLHHGICVYDKTEYPVTLCVSAERVIQVIHEDIKSNKVQINYEEIFTVESKDSRILSSAMSKDSEFLILGTTHGIIVLDRLEKKVVCRRNVSHEVLSLDIYKYPSKYPYLLISVFKDAGKLISFHKFNGNRNELTNHTTNFLVGGHLFDVKKTDEKWSLVAVENKGNIHFRSDADNFRESDQVINFPYQIKRICYNDNDDTAIVGCTNGSVYKVNDDNDYYEMKPQLTGEITYMEKFNDNVIIVSGNLSYHLLGMDENLMFSGKATKAFAYKENTLLVVKKDCSVEFLNTQLFDVYDKRKIAIDSTCIAQSYQDSLLAIATSRNYVYFWKMDDENGGMSSIENQIDEEISSIAISADKSILAVGGFCGNITLFKIQELVPIYILESHKTSINHLQFSPWVDNEGPTILLSLAESINFWNISHIQNNPNGNRMKRNSNDDTRIRVSQRFKSSIKSTPSFDTLDAPMQNMNLNETKWSNKTGSPTKPELLSCIKFLGKNAEKVVVDEKFTCFVTIDSEGNIYHLRLIDQQSDVDFQQRLTIAYNGNNGNSLNSG